VLAALSLHSVSRSRSERAVETKAQIVQQAIDAELDRYRASLADVAAAVGAQTQLEASEFTAIAAPVTQRRLPGAVGVSLVVPAATGEVRRVQTFWRRHGNANLTLSPLAGADVHYFAVLTRRLDGTTPRTGIDAAGAAQPVQALVTARISRAIAISPTYRLLHDADLPAGERQLSFVMAAPVFATSPLSAAGQFRGWIVLAFRGGDFLRTAIGQVAGVQANVELSDTGGEPVPVAVWNSGERVDKAIPIQRRPVTAPQRTWALTIEATEELVPATEERLDEAAIVIGTVITVLLAALTSAIVTSRDRALRNVDQATKALRDDIGRREIVERKLRQREEELVAFAGVVAHDLRSPLANVSALAEVLAEETEDTLSTEHRQFLHRLRLSAARMSDLIDDLLAFAKADNVALRPEVIDLDEIVRDIVAERSTASGHVVAQDLPSVRGDRTLVRQVLDNLIGNGIKYTPPGRAPEVRVSSCPQGPGWCRIDVADRGIGVPEQQRADIFEAFTRASGSEGFQGTGLGLAIVGRIVERHSGMVGVDENPGGGSRFWFTMPVASVPSRSDPATAGSA
jgi:signal transduction histidine kinase